MKTFVVRLVKKLILPNLSFMLPPVLLEGTLLNLVPFVA